MSIAHTHNHTHTRQTQTNKRVRVYGKKMERRELNEWKRKIHLQFEGEEKKPTACSSWLDSTTVQLGTPVSWWGRKWKEGWPVYTFTKFIYYFYSLCFHMWWSVVAKAKNPPTQLVTCAREFIVPIDTIQVSFSPFCFFFFFFFALSGPRPVALLSKYILKS